MAKGAASIKIPLEVEEHEARLYLAMKMFELGKLSLGQAAKYAGYSIHSFIEILGKHGVPVLNQKADELESDVKNAAHGSV
jgi:predicted HTH domain antitoxin